MRGVVPPGVQVIDSGYVTGIRRLDARRERGVGRQSGREIELESLEIRLDPRILRVLLVKFSVLLTERLK